MQAQANTANKLKYDRSKKKQNSDRQWKFTNRTTFQCKSLLRKLFV